jgi:hypothetical protein
MKTTVLGIGADASDSNNVASAWRVSLVLQALSDVVARDDACPKIRDSAAMTAA